MCGIWLLISKKPMTGEDFTSCQKVQKRGPDYTNIVNMTLKDYTLSIAFHRLSIMDPTINGRQPFKLHIPEKKKSIYMICNGEIYNHKAIRRELESRHGIEFYSNSDCEVILHEYINYGRNHMLSSIKNDEFGIIIVEHFEDTDNFNIFATRDPFGVRPLYKGINKEHSFICLSSELKGVPHLDTTKTDQFAPSTYIEISHGFLDNEDEIDNIIKTGKLKHSLYYDIEKYKEYEFPEMDYEKLLKGESGDNFDNVLKRIRTALIDAVVSRVESDRPLGALLSGGLDSSLACAIIMRYLIQLWIQGGRKGPKPSITTVSIGLEEGTDKYFAEKVAKYIGSNHIHFTLSDEDFLTAIKKVIAMIETYDTTTIRASTGQYLAAKMIAEKTDIKAVVLGDGADEVCGGYMYFHKAPSAHEVHLENIRLTKDIHRYDGQRADRCISGHGLEARVPFLDLRFVDTYLSTHPELRKPRNHPMNELGVKTFPEFPIEKFLLREAFKGYLPEECLWRRKEAFSDGVSSQKKSWYEKIQDMCENMYTDEEFEEKAKKYDHFTPATKEELFYREEFEKNFSKNVENVTPYRWVPKYCGDIKEPSARVLDVYASSKPGE